MNRSANSKTPPVWRGYAVATAAAPGCSLVGFAMTPRFDVVNIAMVYLLAVVLVSLRYSRNVALYAALLCVAALDLVFVPPQGTLTVHDVQYLFTFAVIASVALVISDLLERARRESERRAAASIAVETERVRSTLLASISHDLRTPLAVMAGASSSMMEGGDRMGAEERAALARSLYRTTRDMAEQVDKVLQMTRLELGAIELRRDWTSIAEIAGSALSRLSERLADHLLVVEVSEDLPLVRVDASLIEQLLVNLLENAARHTLPGTVVRVRAVVQGKELVVSVEDHGPGLDERDMDRVFEKFYRREGEEGEGGSGRGVGLGLAICRAVVKLHEGRVWAEPVAGGGAALRFALPVEAAPDLSPPEGEEAAAARNE